MYNCYLMSFGHSFIVHVCYLELHLLDSSIHDSDACKCTESSRQIKYQIRFIWQMLNVRYPCIFEIKISLNISCNHFTMILKNKTITCCMYMCSYINTLKGVCYSPFYIKGEFYKT
jgi:hypothetical protein